ncbi:MAG: YdbH domain-containing protein [Rhodobacteraceae bacterium]|nr:YdbH domain-containing protein [Paracoccaceae bacterium]
MPKFEIPKVEIPNIEVPEVQLSRFWRRFLVATLVVVAVLSVVVVLRASIVATTAKQLLASNGVEDASFQVVDVGWSEAVVENVRLGPGLPEVDKLRLGYSLFGLLGGGLSRVTIDGARYQVEGTLNEAVAQLTGGAAEDGDASGGAGVDVDRIEIRDAVIRVTEPEPGEITLSAAFDQTEVGMVGDLNAQIALPLSKASVVAELAPPSAAGAGRRLVVDGEGVIDLGEIPVEIWRAALPEAVAPNSGTARFTVVGDAILAEVPWPRIAAPREIALTGEMVLDQAATEAGAAASADLAWSLMGGSEGLSFALTRAATVSLSGAPWADLGVAVGADSVAEATLAQGELAQWTPEGAAEDAVRPGVLSLSPNLTASIADARLEITGGAKLSHDADYALTEPAQVTFESAVTALPLAVPPALTEEGVVISGIVEQAGVSGEAGVDVGTGVFGATVMLDAALLDAVIPEFSAQATRAQGEAEVKLDADGWLLEVVSGFLLTAADAQAMGLFKSSGEATATLEKLTVGDTGDGVVLDLVAEVKSLNGNVIVEGGDDIRLRGGAGAAELTMDAEAMTLKLEKASAALPQYGYALGSVAAELPLLTTSESTPMSLAMVAADISKPTRHGPLNIALKGARDGDAAKLGGSVRPRRSGVRFPVSISADMAAFTGSATVPSTTITFEKGGLQPEAFGGIAKLFRDARGAVTLGGRARFGETGLDGGKLELSFDKLTMSSDIADVTNMNGGVVLALPSLRTDGAQEISADKVVLGVPLDNPSLRFNLAPDGDAVITTLETFTADLADGQVGVENAQWRNAISIEPLNVAIQDIDIDRLLKQWLISGVSGTGRLTGVIPIAFQEEGVAIVEGAVASSVPGVVKVDWGPAREQLVTAAEQVRLTVEALEDFHYTSLTIDLNQPVGEDLSLAIGLDGANPAVLDNYPFRFNVTLTGNLEPILSAVREGRRIGGDLFQGGLGLP